jgi:hypothetical protein
VFGNELYRELTGIDSHVTLPIIQALIFMGSEVLLDLSVRYFKSRDSLITCFSSSILSPLYHGKEPIVRGGERKKKRKK